MKIAGQVDAVFKKYGLQKNITPDVQSHFIRTRKKVLRSILKETGEYSFWTGRGITTYYLCKKIGLRLSLFKSYIMFIFILLLMVFFLGYGAYLFYCK